MLLNCFLEYFHWEPWAPFWKSDYPEEAMRWESSHYVERPQVGRHSGDSPAEPSFLVTPDNVPNMWVDWICIYSLASHMYSLPHYQHFPPKDAFSPKGWSYKDNCNHPKFIFTLGFTLAVIFMWVYFLALYPVPWIYLSVLWPIPHWVEYCSFTVGFEEV